MHVGVPAARFPEMFIDVRETTGDRILNQIIVDSNAQDVPVEIQGIVSVTHSNTDVGRISGIRVIISKPRLYLRRRLNRIA